MEERQTITRKVQIYPVGSKEEVDRVYKYIRDGMFNQNKAMNQYISALYMATIQEASKEDRQELNRLYTRISTSKKGSAYTTDVKFPTGLPCTSSLGQKVKNDFSKSIRDGLLYGKVALPTYRKDNPLLVHVDYVRLRSTNPHQDTGLYHNYASHQDFLDNLYKDVEIFIKFANGITFKLIFGNPHKSAELRSVMKNIFEEYYDVQGSSIQFDRSGKKMMLNLSLSIPKNKVKLDENTVVGVDLGLAIPAMCGLNNNNYIKRSIGSRDEFLRVRTQMQSQRRRLQRSLKSSGGGHGRNKKLRNLERLKAREASFAQTYNHYVSKNVVDFAVENNAKYINLEDLTGYDLSKFILRNWSYYQLQQYITYKAGIRGIEVRKINPQNTSLMCSECGNLEDGQRLDQAHFKCKKCGAEMNADFNAARNIANSTDYR